MRKGCPVIAYGDIRQAGRTLRDPVRSPCPIAAGWLTAEPGRAVPAGTELPHPALAEQKRVAMNTAYCPRPAGKLHIEALPHAGPEERFFVLEPSAPSWAVINRDAMELLRLCDGTRSLADIASCIGDSGTDPAEALQTTVSFIGEMVSNRILQTGDEKQPPRENRFQGIALEITGKCNLRCRHCYLAAGRSAQNELTGREIRALVDEVADNGGFSVAVGGGEPLLRPDWLEIVNHALAAGLLVSVGTNATLIDERLAATMADLPVKIQISLDGATEAVHDSIRGKGSYRAAVRGIDALVERGKSGDLVIAFTPMRPNHHEVEAIIWFARERGIPVVQYPPLSRSGRATEQWEELCLDRDQTVAFWETVRIRSAELQGEMDLLADCFSMDILQAGRPYQCSIGTQFRIDPQGNVYPCQCFHHGTEFLLGNIRSCSLGSMVNGDRIRRIRELSRKRATMITGCRTCRWQGYCGGGCMGSAYELTGDVLTSPACNVRRQWIETRFASILEQASGSGMSGA